MARCADANPRVNWQRNQPIIHFLRQLIPSFFPLLTSHGRRGQHESGVGGYNADPHRGAHNEGRAADIYANASRADEKAIGDGLFRIFSHHAYELGVENVTWNHRSWDARDLLGVSHPFTGDDPHTDHVHVSFTCEGSQRQPPALPIYFKLLAQELGKHAAR